ncbi:MAG TPA: DHA2 family efflux MFS transporter permease subunit [Thermoanaerobaculia bacterium]
MQPGRERRLVTSALMLGMFLAALEGTAVAAAVPTAVGQLGGMERYSWVFSAYLLASTTTVPLYGKLADLFGRRRIYQVAVALFLLGSGLSGAAPSFGWLILFRALQGLGAGGVLPVATTIVGDIYNLKERARIQGLFSGVWAMASLLGPLLGGLITVALSWRWIFYLNIPFGLASALLLERYFPEEPARRRHAIDLLGTLALTGSVTALLLALIDGGTWGFSDPRTEGLLAAAVAGLALFVWQERRAPEPMLPLDLFASPLIAVASVGNALLGALLFALTAYVPMFGQGVLGGTAVDAGTLLSPVLVGWPISSTLAGWILLRTGYRPLALGGGVLIVLGSVLLAFSGLATPHLQIMTAMFVVGLGMGFTSMPYLLGVQNAVPWDRRGVATGTVQFFRNIGGAVAVAALGALHNASLVAHAGPTANANAALDPTFRASLAPATLAQLTTALLAALQAVFVAIAALAVITLAVAFLFPRGTAESHARSGLERQSSSPPAPVP